MPVKADDFPYKPGKIKPEEMDLSFYLEKYPGEPAIILGDAADCRFGFDGDKGFQFQFERQVRILVLTEVGLDYGDFSISFYESAGSTEEIDNFKAWVHNVDDEKVLSERIKLKDGFVRDKGNNMKQLVFAMPGVKVGSVIDVTYRITSDFLFQLRHWQFQHEIPVLHSEYRLNLPSFFAYRSRYNGSFKLDIIEQEEKTDSWVVPRVTESAYGQVDNGYYRVIAQSNVFRWVAYNVKPLKPEPFMDNVSNYQARLIFEFMFEQYPDSEPVNFTTSWEDVSDYLYKNKYFGKYLDSCSTVVGELMPDQILETKAEQIQYALETISSKVKWNDDSSLFTDYSPAKVLELGAGNSAEINLLLVSLLNKLKLKAYPVLATTIENGRLVSDSPTLTQWNYVTVALEIGPDQIIVLDATVNKPIAGYLPQRLINEDGRIISPTLNAWLSLDQNTETQKGITYDVTLNDDGDLTGVVTLKVAGYGRYLYLQNDKIDDAKLFWQKYFRNDNLEISQESVSYDATDNRPIELSAHIHIPGYAQKIGDEMIINSLLFEAKDENLLQAAERGYPLYFNNTLNSLTTINIELPDNMKLSFIPDEVKKQWGRWNHKLTVVETEKGYQVSWEERRGLRVIPTQNYSGFRRYYSQKIDDNMQTLIIEPKETAN